MSKTYTITLGGQTYTCHPFNLGELERVVDFYEMLKPSQVSNAILALALERAVPEVADLRLIEADVVEVQAAIKAVLKASGMNVAETVEG